MIVILASDQQARRIDAHALGGINRAARAEETGAAAALDWAAMLALGFMGGHHNGLNGSAIIIAVASRALSVFTRMMRAAPALTMRGVHRSCAAGWPRLALPAGGCSTPAA
ncbi:hypothetical protein J2X20_002109 [Pelomonas saccharophila]|uniref:Uncharacterized protein n=1 Tax=Roseateles saccharophilus TaxID=304 RepID=A0ABU1YMM0_ROSSA|nr:hypothetical protein [Roseateles saccharophilus]MDR7269480.1 hypothetical protein [Roseateles saccharophilus]